MTYPLVVNKVTVTAQYFDEVTRKPTYGTVFITAQSNVAAIDGNIMLMGGVRTGYSLNPLGQLADDAGNEGVELTAGDDDYAPNFVYKIQEDIGPAHQGSTYFINLTADLVGEPYDLITAEHVDPGDPVVTAYFPKAGGTITGDTEIDAALTVTGASHLAATTATTVTATGAVAGASVAATAAVTGATVAASGTVQGATVAATGNATVGGTLGVTGAATVGSVNTTGNAALGTTGITGTATISGNVAAQSGLAVAGNETVGGTLAVTGQASVGSLLVGGSPVTGSGAIGQHDGIAALDGFGRVPTRQSSDLCQVGAYFNSYTLNDATTTESSPTTITALETDLKTTFDYAVMFGGITANGSFSSGAWAKVQAFLDAGRKVVINIALNGTIANINAGQFDTGIGQFGAYIAAYAAANPGWKDRIIFKFMHELNQGSYTWAVFTTQNLSDNGGSVATTTASAITAYQRIATAARAAATTGGVCYLLTTFEIATVNDATTAENSFIPFDTFYPGDAYVDIVSTNVYNRYGLSSGNSVWTSFETQAAPPLEAFRRFAPLKPIMIGESSTNDAGMINTITVNSGGTGYGGSTTVTASAPGTGATLTPVISSGVISSVTINQRGRNFNNQTTLTLANTGGGTGATFTAGIIAEKNSKATWFRDALAYVRDQSDVKYFSFFFTNTGSSGDYRFWAPNSTVEKTAVAEGVTYVRNRNKAGFGRGLTARGRIGINLHPDPYTNDVSKWTAAGSNVGTLARTASTANIPSLDTAPGDGTGVLRLTHNGTAGSAQDNRIYTILSQNQTIQNENFVLSFDACFKPSSTGGVGWMNAGLETNDSNQFLRKLQPGALLTPDWQRYRVFTYTTTSSTGYRIAFCIGRSSAAGFLLISNIKLEYGDHETPMERVQRQLTRTTVADVAYSFVNGSTDEVLAYTSLTAARTVTLPDVTAFPVGITKTVKDEAGTAGTNNITLATTSSQTIDGASTKVLSSNYGTLKVYSSGTAWFTI